MRIQHKNLTIRQAEVTDAKQLAAWWNDGAVMAHAGFPNGLGTTEEEVVKGLRNGLLVIEENWVLQKSQSVHTPAVLAILQVQQDRLFVRIYEDNVAGKLDDGRFAMMSKNYTEEQKNLKTEVKSLQQRIHEQEQQAENIEQFVQRVKKNGTLTELTPYALRELAKAVYVEAPNKSSGKRRQKVHIEYDFVGYIPVDELLKEEQA